MIQIKKKFFNIIKLIFVTIFFLILILFLYAAFFYNPPINNKEVQVSEKENLEEEIKKLEEGTNEIEERVEEVKENEITENTEAIEENKIKEINTSIKDGVYVTVGNKAITQLDIVQEIKIILILNNISYSEEKRDELQKLATKSVIKRTVRDIEISKFDFLEYSNTDLNNKLIQLANNIKMDVDILESVSLSNGIDIQVIKDQIKSELLWNSLIFYLYRNRLSVNQEEIDEQLKLSQNKKEFMEYLISEIVIEPVENDKIESRVNEVKNKISKDGFESVAMNTSISQTASSGGDLGWVNENEISQKLRSTISNTAVGNISDPILVSEGILLFKVRDKKKVTKKVDLEMLKDKLVKNEKTKILNMYSKSHYDSLRRSILIKFMDE